MNSLLTFYLSRVLNQRVYHENRKVVGRLKDLIVDMSKIRPRVVAAVIGLGGNKSLTVDFSTFTISKEKNRYIIECVEFKETLSLPENILYLRKNILDRQIVDIDGKKVVRVNDLRLATLSNGTYAIAVDVGFEGLLRRLGIAKIIKYLLKPFGAAIPSKLILWEEVETIDYPGSGIKLSKTHTKLNTLHPSDLADIIEELDMKTQAAVFASLDDEKAADVLEELESDAQVNVIESMSVEKAADMLEMLPADEAADILDEIEEEKAEELLNEMPEETSEEIRELMEYPDNKVGSIMSTDYFFFNENLTVNETIDELRRLKPESDMIYYLYVVDDAEKLVAVVSLRDMVVAQPDIRLNSIMKRDVIFVHDNDDVNILAGIISKYSLLAVPVVDREEKLLGVVVINDIVYSLLKTMRKRQ